MNTYLTRRWGNGATNPSTPELLRALEELATADAEHPDTWLSDEDGWTVSVFESGSVTFENIEDGAGRTYQRQNVSREQAYRLWLLLQQGCYSEIMGLLTSGHPF